MLKPNGHPKVPGRPLESTLVYLLKDEALNKTYEKSLNINDLASPSLSASLPPPPLSVCVPYQGSESSRESLVCAQRSFSGIRARCGAR